jgi:pimeloyl-[acyl-carrier protein] synthase
MRAPEVTFDFSATAFIEDPYRRYAEVQRDSPVFRTADGSVYLARHADCAALLAEPRFRRRSAPDAQHPFAARTPLEAMLSQWMLFMDPPRHDAVRAAFAPWFSAQSVSRCEAAVRAICTQLIDRLDERGDFVSAVASPLPVLVLCELVGLPTADRSRFEEWSATLTRALESGTETEMREAVPASLEMRDYFAREPLPGLTADETVYGLAFLIWAGHETTRNLIASGMLALCEHPGELRRLREQPDLVRGAVEELLRYASPVQKLSRWTSEETLFGDYVVPAGTMVTALVGAANRDPAAFVDPQRLDVTREQNRHLSFGRGLHTCLGAGLARLEAQIAIPAILARFGSIEATAHHWRPNSALRGLDMLELRLR